MNSNASNRASGPTCQPKSYFAIILQIDDGNGGETEVPGVTIDLKLSDLGDVQRLTALGPPVFIGDLEPGGTGDVLQMTHAINVYEAIGDFS